MVNAFEEAEADKKRKTYNHNYAARCEDEDEGRRKITINMPCRSWMEVLLPASKRLEVKIAPQN
ncbi:hypothetical protein A1F99_106670 [Pyrenophora tritici-repentis]|uniref:Uncharacterized protein n=2 Tax=Pyrenophora tritici-repentis TaxID=45151 RepID=A0A317AU38_9PLEO|nr:uncharacterized protein PTRG_06841 [Pyrenophora tritici-repentis Pt-1C-BFP]KAF7445681.1 hypothetical protein A1F99_106670 [Pyrenophora tritici-repentis]EDU49761.1 predicted protein [Pyrenophora tritici-repentis Pt-1C-BFP]KAI1509631.1 hypothetical protein Ptr86124_011217 [Pyrenophora tritici-repentis]KAI1676700.1 hypothetical protein KJE20_13715 [Pyrenophora tritici-repentis]PWO20080.1 acetyltransferase [Pyrenophora tritici-repentis]